MALDRFLTDIHIICHFPIFLMVKITFFQNMTSSIR